ncbi:MAG TPA: cytochrome c oxidase subunit 3 [Cytophagales bacterium]|nr:cytochrome c oxidase subunit 3 [Cytophagales bacterium]
MVGQHKISNNIEEPTPTLSMNPHKFALWLFIITIIMIFASLTSAYIVRAADGNWVEFDLPQVLWLNTIALFASSLTMHWAYISAKRNNLGTLKLAISITLVLGAAFVIGQFFAWKDLVAMEIFFTGNPSGSFLYILTGVHGFHLITGLAFLIIVLISSFKYKIHSKNLTKIEICATYWHFLDGLWIYLFVFLLMNHL